MSLKRLACWKLESKSYGRNSENRHRKYLKRFRNKWLRKVSHIYYKYHKEYEY